MKKSLTYISYTGTIACMRYVHMLTCKGGKPIDNERILKYENMCHFLVQKFLPARALYEASMDYDDLINQCRYEVMRALMNFDPKIAVKSFRNKKALDENGEPIILKFKKGKPVFKMVPDEDLREKEEQRKALNPELAKTKAEESLVYGRLKNYLRRTRWKYSPAVFGGQTIRVGLSPTEIKVMASIFDDIETLEDFKMSDFDTLPEESCDLEKS